jgi:hypothetical protein
MENENKNKMKSFIKAKYEEHINAVTHLYIFSTRMVDKSTETLDEECNKLMDTFEKTKREYFCAIYDARSVCFIERKINAENISK